MEKEKKKGKYYQGASLLSDHGGIIFLAAGVFKDVNVATVVYYINFDYLMKFCYLFSFKFYIFLK